MGSCINCRTDELIATNQIKAWQFLFAAVEEGSFEVSAAFTCQLFLQYKKTLFHSHLQN
jgi:hypothetical protein